MSSKTLPDAIKIVPTRHHPTKLIPAGLSYRGGPLIKNVAIHSVYWGNYWSTASSPSTADIDGFLSFLVQSSFMNELFQYSEPAYPIGMGSLVQSTVLNIAVGASITDAEIQAQVRSFPLSTKSNPEHPPVYINDLYMVFVPPGVQVVMGGTMSCSSFCGYHDDISGARYYGVIAYPNCVGCDNAGSVFNSLTMVTSHEVAEAITDPIPGAGWYDNQFGEIGDFCNAQPKTLGAYTVQKIWSASAQQCV
jgi:hypothetical protein